ncbi:MAG: IclR family transcriptional regulator [Desulfobacterales bacterium]|nr:MAG: IclR family transcriptional regulator [Desulfobacterales bacterium]
MVPKKEKPSNYRAPAVQKAFELLRIVAESRQELGLSAIAKSLGFSKSTTHGLIQALLDIGALDQNPQRKRFFLGPAVVELAFRSWNYLRVVEHAQPLLDELRDQIGETVFLGALSRSRGLIMATAEATKPLKISSPPGTTIPLLAGAVGKVFLAQQENQQIVQLLDDHGLPRFTDHSIVTSEDYLAELERVRQQGYALDKEEYLPGVRAVAVALGNHRGLPLAVWVVGFADSMNDRLLPGVVRATLDTARKLQVGLENGS